MIQRKRKGMSRNKPLTSAQLSHLLDVLQNQQAARVLSSRSISNAGLTTGEYPLDLANPPSRPGGLGRLMSQPLGFQSFSSTTPRSKQSPQDFQQKGFTQQGFIQQDFNRPYSSGPKRRPSIVPSTRRSTQYRFNLQELGTSPQAPIPPNQMQRWEEDEKRQQYFVAPVMGYIPRTEADLIIEEAGEKYCRCVLHIQSSYLDRIATEYQHMGFQEPLTADFIMQIATGNTVVDGRSISPALQKEVEAFFRAPFARCQQQRYGPLTQLRKQGLSIKGQRSGDCGPNYNLNEIPTKELYGLALSRARSGVNQQLLPVEDFPPYFKNEQQMDQYRPVLLQLLQPWYQEQQTKLKTTAESSRPHFRNY